MTGEIPRPDPDRPRLLLSGIGAAPGVAVGRAYVYAAGTYAADEHALAPDEVEGEVRRFESAVARAERELGKIAALAHEKLGADSAAMFEAQALMLHDPGLYEGTRDRILKDGISAGRAVEAVMEAYRQHLAAAGNAHLRERAADLLDLQNRLLRNLQRRKALSRIEADRVVVAETLTAADIMLFSRRGVRAVVLDHGGPTGHAVLIARALGIPCVVGLQGRTEVIRAGEEVVVDGFSGEVVVHPTEADHARYDDKRARHERLRADRDEMAHLESVTQDGHPVPLRANVEFTEELPLLAENRAAGIGLFRTEFLFLSEGRALDEDEQRQVYVEALRASAPHPVTFRLIDLGGDKLLPMAHREPNPALGWRGVRVLLQRPDLLRTQLRALFRAAAEVPDGTARLMIPMVSGVDEVVAVRRSMSEAADQLTMEGAEHRSDLPLGIMVEVPATALLADRFAPHADFFSIGTNDLTGLTLGVDRGNDLVADRYQEHHPSVLHLIHLTCGAAKAAGLTVSVCGEMASNPRAVPLLIGLGVDELSASPAYLPDLKRVVRDLTLADASALAALALAQPGPDDVRRITGRYLADHHPDLAALLNPELNPEAARPTSDDV